MLFRQALYPLLAAMSLTGVMSVTPIPAVKQATVGLPAGSLELGPSNNPFLYVEGPSGNLSFIFQEDANLVA